MTDFFVDCRVVCYPLGSQKIKECVTVDEDGFYTIFLNDDLSDVEKVKSCCHAIRHIANRDFEKESADRIEHYAHLIAKGGNL